MQIVNQLTQEEGEVGRLVKHGVELFADGKCVAWVGRFGVPGDVTAAYLFPDDTTVIPALLANLTPKLLREFQTWDQETFQNVVMAVLGTVKAFNDIGSQLPRRPLNIQEFNTIFQQNPMKLKIIPLEVKFF